MTEQQAQLGRVSDRIASVVLDFYQGRVSDNPEFHMEELLGYVSDHVDVAPDSPGRILRNLRAEKKLNYAVVNRKQSLYKLVPLEMQ